MQSENVKNAINLLKAEKKMLQEKIKRLDKFIDHLEAEYASFSPPQNGEIPTEKPVVTANENTDIVYNKNSTFKEKIFFVFELKKKFLFNGDFVEVLIKNEPNTDIDELKSKVSVQLSRLRSKGSIVKINLTKNSKDVCWGLPDWIDENGKIREEYKPEAKSKGFNMNLF